MTSTAPSPTVRLPIVLAAPGPSDRTESPAGISASLPRWDLDDLYQGGVDSADLQRDLEAVAAAADAFHARHHGRVNRLDGAGLAVAIAEYERLSEVLGRIGSYVGLMLAGNITDPAIGRFYQAVSERTTDISSQTLFFTLEINRLGDAALESMLTDPGAARYRPWLRTVRAFRDHQLTDDVEQVLHEQAIVGNAAWVRLFDETLTDLRFPVGDQRLTLTETVNLLTDPDRGVRRDAARAVGTVLGDNARLFTRIMNTLVKEKELDDRRRRFPHALAARNLANQVEDTVVEALVAAVKESWPRLAHRYYTLKARWFGLERLEFWDRNAPLPGDTDRRYDWDEACRVVTGAYRAFSPELAAVGETFFARPWIDAEVRPGKASGAFAHGTVPSAHPYLLVNYQGKGRDVMTLAHELGHGCHQVLAGGQGYLMAATPLTLAETASVFGEMLTFRALLAAETDPARRRVMLAAKVEDALNTVVRQIAFHEFERTVHEARRVGELAADDIARLWLAVQTESLGPAFHFDDDYRHYWAYIPHFVHSPFYVYAYAFGDCLVNSLYAAYESGMPGFAEKYLDMLRAGGTLRHGELLAPFGLDASDPAFWRRGLDMIAGMIDELERMGS